MKMTKRLFAIAMAVVTFVSVMGIATEAASVSLAKLNLGYMAPTNSKGTKIIETVKLYGDYDYINFYINSKKKSSYFFYEIYSDKDLTKGVESGYIYCNNGEYAFSQKIKLKGKYKSKTYYLVTYAAKIYSDGSAKIDKKSMREFQIKVDIKADFDEKVVVLKEVKNTVKGACVKWSKLSGASKYYIYRRSITGSKWTKVGTVSSKNTTFTDTSVKNKNGNYIYTVKAVNKKGTASRYLYAGLKCLFAKAPVINSVSVIGNNTVQVKWGSTKSGAKYNVVRKEPGGSWATIATNYSGTTYNDKTAVNGKKYTYSVKAVISTSYGKATSSYYANNDKVVTYLKAPTLNSVTKSKNGPNIKWSAVAGANTYKICRMPLDKSESWRLVGTVGSGTLTFTDKTASADGSYIYTVRADSAKNKGSYYSAGIEHVVLDAPIITVNRYASDIDGIELVWQEVPFADQYNIYAMDENGQWKIQKKVKDTFYSTCYTSFVPDKYGKTKYTITALRDGTNETTVGSKIYEVDFYPSIDIEVAEIRKEGNLLRWKDKGAQKYNVYRSIGEEAGYELFQVVDVTQNGQKISFVDTDVEEGTYNYVVKGVFDNIEQDVYYANKTLCRASDENIVRNENVSFYRNRAAHTIKFKVDTGDYEKEYYAYNYVNDTWKRISPNENIIHTDASMSNKDGEYTVAVVYIVDGAKTPVDSVTYTGKFWDVSFDTVSATSIKTGTRIEWKEIDGAVKYIVRYSLEGSEEITEIAEVPINNKGKYHFDFERDKSKDNYVCFIVEAVDAEGRITAINKIATADPNPEMYAAVRKDNGEVWVYWNYYWQGQDFIVMRKTEGGSWKVIDKNCYQYHPQKYKGKECSWFVDKTAKAGVKYTYTVISKNRGEIGDVLYIDSYYDTKGVTCKG